MKSYSLTLSSPVSKSYRCQKAADALDIDTAKKSVHKFTVKADLETDYSIGIIVGASGSGKTTLAKEIFGDDCFKEHLDLSAPVIEQFPDEYSSVVDRTVAKVMSHCVQKHARKQNKQIVLCSCHYDILEWVQPDWVIDCNSQTYEDFRDVKKKGPSVLPSTSGRLDQSHGDILANIII